ncbi:MAG: hypothetical protein DWQ31_03740 [Planctomycetota bacterium]|nr:MAG: hypothetical protein DWQ31_03740 [Planctomycetota bacterium]REJ90478.1 MAG: hypothetical protein DWQ35_16295 [Planctomycetota bacterium]
MGRNKSKKSSPAARRPAASTGEASLRRWLPLIVALVAIGSFTTWVLWPQGNDDLATTATAGSPPETSLPATSPRRTSPRASGHGGATSGPGQRIPAGTSGSPSSTPSAAASPESVIPAEVTFAAPLGLTRPDRPEGRYVGSAVCAECHDDVADEYRGHPMGMDNFTKIAAASAVEDYTQVECAIAGPRRYRVERQGDDVYHRELLVDAAGETIFERAHRIDYVVGSGQQGRSYLIDHGGILHQSPITWYVHDHEWAFSPGYRPLTPYQFDRRIQEGCLRCHVGLANEEVPGSSRYRDPVHRETFISCERCHGPGEVHVRLNEEESTAEGIVNPDELAPRQRDSVCYQCHLSSKTALARYGYELRDFRPGQSLEDVLLVFVDKRDASAEQNRIASQAEQMESSRCYQASGGQMGCTSCHDPHARPAPAEREAFYQASCLACHEGGHDDCGLDVAEQMAEPATGSCVHCHMPTAPSRSVGHITLSDHRILKRPEALALSDETIAQAEREGHDSVADLVIFATDEASLPPRERARAYGRLYTAEAARRGDRALLQKALAQLIPSEVRASRDIEVVLDALGDDKAVIGELAFIYVMLGDLDRALACYRRGLAIDPRDDRLLTGLVDCYARRGEPQKALAALAALRAVSPFLADTHKHRTRLLNQVGRVSEARQVAEERLARDPLNGPLRTFLIRSYARTGEREKSEQHRRLAERIRAALTAAGSPASSP